MKQSSMHNQPLWISGGIITKQDLQNYVAVVKEPLVVTLNDNSTIFTPPPPSSGAVYAMILNIADSE